MIFGRKRKKKIEKKSTYLYFFLNIYEIISGCSELFLDAIHNGRRRWINFLLWLVLKYSWDEKDISWYSTQDFFTITRQQIYHLEIFTNNTSTKNNNNKRKVFPKHRSIIYPPTLLHHEKKYLLQSIPNTKFVILVVL